MNVNNSNSNESKKIELIDKEKNPNRKIFGLENLTKKKNQRGKMRKFKTNISNFLFKGSPCPWADYLQCVNISETDVLDLLNQLEELNKSNNNKRRVKTPGNRNNNFSDLKDNFIKKEIEKVENKSAGFLPKITKDIYYMFETFQKHHVIKENNNQSIEGNGIIFDLKKQENKIGLMLRILWNNTKILNHEKEYLYDKYKFNSKLPKPIKAQHLKKEFKKKILNMKGGDSNYEYFEKKFMRNLIPGSIKLDNHFRDFEEYLEEKSSELFEKGKFLNGRLLFYIFMLDDLYNFIKIFTKISNKNLNVDLENSRLLTFSKSQLDQIISILDYINNTFKDLNYGQNLEYKKNFEIKFNFNNFEKNKDKLFRIFNISDSTKNKFNSDYELIRKDIDIIKNKKYLEEKKKNLKEHLEKHYNIFLSDIKFQLPKKSGESNNLNTSENENSIENKNAIKYINAYKKNIKGITEGNQNSINNLISVIPETNNSEINELKNKVSELEKSLEDQKKLQTKLNELEENKTKLETEIKKTTTMGEKDKKTIELKNRQVRMLLKVNSDIEKMNNKLEIENNIIESVQKDLVELIKELYQKSLKLTEELEITKKKHESEKKRLENDYEKKITEITEEQEQKMVRKLREEKNRYESSLSQKQDEHESILTEENEKHKTEMKNLKNKEREERGKLRTDIFNLEKKIKEINEKKYEEEIKVSKLKTELKIKESEMKKKTKKLEDQIDEQKSFIDKIKQKLENANSDKKQELENQEKIHKNKIRQLKTQIEQTEIQNQRNNISLKTELKNNITLLEQYTRELNKKNEEEIKLRTQMENIMIKNNNLISGLRKKHSDKLIELKSDQSNKLEKEKKKYFSKIKILEKNNENEISKLKSEQSKKMNELIKKQKKEIQKLRSKLPFQEKKTPSIREKFGKMFSKKINTDKNNKLNKKIQERKNFINNVQKIETNIINLLNEVNLTFNKLFHRKNKINF